MSRWWAVPYFTNNGFSFSFSLHETDIHKENHRLEPMYRAEMFLDRDYCMSQGPSYNYLDPNYFPANRWQGKQMCNLKHSVTSENPTAAQSLILCPLWKGMYFPRNVIHCMRASQVPFTKYSSLTRLVTRSLNRGWTFLVCSWLYRADFLHSINL